MYTSYIGKKFLEIFKKEYNKPDDYSAEQFFDEEMFPLFFDYDRYCMRVKNSTFDQLTTTGAKKKLYKKSEERKKAKEELKTKIYNDEFAVHTFVGAGEMNFVANTSGQITNINFDYNTEEYYCSWIGQGLAIKTGKYNILIEKEEILLHIFKGWEYYREALEKTSELSKNQVNTWNTKWLINKFKDDKSLSLRDSDVDTKKDVFLIKSTNWVDLVFFLAKTFPREEMLINAYEIGDRNNTSLGFIQLILPEIDEMWELKDKIFIDPKDKFLSDYILDKLITHYNFKGASSFGTIGLISLKPASLRPYLNTNSSLPNDCFNKYKIKIKETNGKIKSFEKDEVKHEFYINKLWLITMLSNNKDDIIKISKNLAKTLHEFTILKDSISTSRENLIEEKLLKEFSKKSIYNNLSEIIEKKNLTDEFLVQIKEFRNRVHFYTKDETEYFMLLLKFDYLYIKTKGV